MKTIKNLVLFLLVLTNLSVSKPVKELPLAEPIEAHPVGGLEEFMLSIAIRESNNKYKTISKYNMYGKYQFAPMTLRHFGIRNYKTFLYNESLQDSLMILNMKQNAYSLSELIETLDGTYWGDVYITKSGLLAGAHLMGPGGVLSYFYPEIYNFRVKDANGIHVLEYIREFSGYDLSEIGVN